MLALPGVWGLREGNKYHAQGLGFLLVCVWMQVGVWCSGPTMEEPFPLCGTLRQKSSLHPEPSRGFSALSFMNSLKIALWGDLEGTGWDSFLFFNPSGQLLYIQRQGGSGEKGCEREIKQVYAQLGSRKLGVPCDLLVSLKLSRLSRVRVVRTGTGLSPP